MTQATTSRTDSHLIKYAEYNQVQIQTKPMSPVAVRLLSSEVKNGTNLRIPLL